MTDLVSLWRHDTINPPPRPTMRQIARRTAERHGVSLDDMMGLSRRPRIAQARQEAMHEIRQATTFSLPQIGRFFNRDHTTVIHGVRAHEQRMIERGEINGRLDEAE